MHFFFITSGTELGYYLEKIKVQVTLQIKKELRTQTSHLFPPSVSFSAIVLLYRMKSDIKLSIEIPILIDVFN